MLIGILGVAGAGKDATADILTKKHGFCRVALADELKRTAQRWYEFTDTQLWGPSEERNKPDPRYGDLSPRKVLQTLGTEVGRQIYPNTWVDYMLRVANRLLDPTGTEQPCYSPEKGLFFEHREGAWDPDKIPMGIVIPDVRFQNEVDSIRATGGHVIKITRPGAGLQGTAGQHTSETEQEHIPRELFSYFLPNTGTLEDLEKKVARMMEMLQGHPVPAT